MAVDENSVKEFWQARAGDQTIPNEAVTHPDISQRWLEIEMIKDHLKPTDRVLDVGCGNGHTTRQVAPHVREIVGMDFADEMINRARSVDLAPDCKAAVQFVVHSVLDLDVGFMGSFDVVLSERCLINLTDWKSQKRAIENIASVVKSGGAFIFVEGSRQGRDRLNASRSAAGLEEMPNVWHNIDFDEDRTLEHLGKFFTLEHRSHCGLYDFISRIVHPLLVAPQQPQYDSKINKIGAELCRLSDEFANLSRVMFLVLRKA